jgi:hypothetical protein
VVAPASGRALVSWIDYRSGFPDVLVARSDDRGDSWSDPVRVDTGSDPGVAGSYDLSFGAEGDLVVAAWADDRAGFLDVYANYSLDGGVTWQPQDHRLDTSPVGTSDSVHPHVFVATGAAHVVWVDHRRGGSCPAGLVDAMSCANGDIYYNRLE